MTDDAALNVIARLLEKSEWDAELLGEVANVVRTTGRRVKLADLEDEVRPDGPETEKGGLIGQQPY